MLYRGSPRILLDNKMHREQQARWVVMGREDAFFFFFSSGGGGASLVTGYVTGVMLLRDLVGGFSEAQMIAVWQFHQLGSVSDPCQLNFFRRR
jgi:hypothetical protein